MNERYLYTFELALEMPQHFMFRPKIACSTRLTRAACSPIVRNSGCLAVDNLSALKRWKRHSRPRNVREPPTGDRHSQPQRGSLRGRATRCAVWRARTATRCPNLDRANPRIRDPNMIRPGAIMFVQTHDPTIRTCQQVANAKAVNRNGQDS
jgi:hypothetical protein